MATTTTAAPRKTQSPLSPEARANFFRTKMEAEWGPYNLQHALEAKDGRVIVIDTRDAESFAKEHIPGAVNIPTDELSKRLKELPRDKELVPYCWSVVCHLATQAALYLSEQGYRVHELAGGIEYWKHYNMPLEKAEGQATS